MSPLLPTAQSANPKDDPSVWSRNYCAKMVVSCDWGYAQDHTAIVACGRYQLGSGVNITGVPFVKQFPLQTPPNIVISELRLIAQTLSSSHGRASILIDSRSNSAFFSQILQSGLQAIGFSLTGAERHATRPQPFRTTNNEGKIMTGLEWMLSRTQLFDDLGAVLGNSQIRITKTGDAPKLLSELKELRRRVTASRKTVYEHTEKSHDDLAVALAAGVWGVERIAPSRRNIATHRRTAPRASAWT